MSLPRLLCTIFHLPSSCHRVCPLPVCGFPILGWCLIWVGQVLFVSSLLSACHHWPHRRSNLSNRSDAWLPCKEAPSPRILICVPGRHTPISGSIVSRALQLAGVDTTGFSGHSFRIGAATTAAKIGINDSLIQTLGHWKSAAFREYVRTGEPTLISISSRLANASS